MATRYQVDRRGEYRIFKIVWPVYEDGPVPVYHTKYVIAFPSGHETEFTTLEAARIGAEALNNRPVTAHG